MGCSLVCVYVLFCLNSNDFGLSLYLHWLRTRATAGRPGPGPGASKASSYTVVIGAPATPVHRTPQYSRIV